jgi:hypothetical protein
VCVCIYLNHRLRFPESSPMQYVSDSRKIQPHTEYNWTWILVNLNYESHNQSQYKEIKI